jgi:hypothetical protein
VNGSSPAAELYHRAVSQMIALFLLLVIVAIAPGIAGVATKGLLFLLLIDIVVFLGALVFGVLRMQRPPGISQRGNPPEHSNNGRLAVTCQSRVQQVRGPAEW